MILKPQSTAAENTVGKRGQVGCVAEVGNGSGGGGGRVDDDGGNKRTWVGVAG